MAGHGAAKQGPQAAPGWQLGQLRLANASLGWFPGRLQPGRQKPQALSDQELPAHYPGALRIRDRVAPVRGKDYSYGMGDNRFGGGAGHDFFARRLLRQIIGAAW